MKHLIIVTLVSSFVAAADSLPLVCPVIVILRRTRCSRRQSAPGDQYFRGDAVRRHDLPVVNRPGILVQVVDQLNRLATASRTPERRVFIANG